MTRLAEVLEGGGGGGRAEGGGWRLLSRLQRPRQRGSGPETWTEREREREDTCGWSPSLRSELLRRLYTVTQ